MLVAVSRLLRPGRPCMCSGSVYVVAGFTVNPPCVRSTLASVPCAGCKPGYTYLRKRCQKCAAGTFKKAAGNGRCAHCAGNTYSQAAATKCRFAADLHVFSTLPGLTTRRLADFGPDQCDAVSVDRFRNCSRVAATVHASWQLLPRGDLP